MENKFNVTLSGYQSSGEIAYISLWYCTALLLEAKAFNRNSSAFSQEILSHHTAGKVVTN